MKKLLTVFAAIFVFAISSVSVFAYTGDISINQKNITFSTGKFLEGTPVRIYATIVNHSNLDLLGVVKFFDNGSQIGADQAVSIFKGATDGVFVDWAPGHGQHQVSVKLYPWIAEIDDPNNNWIVTDIFVIQDTDHDGTPNETDEDDDNDGVPDTEDDFPLNSQEQYDTDGDGKGDNTDNDDDNDDVPDEFDDLPLDPNETLDTDKDGIGNNTDTDDDGDGLTDSEEENLKTDPLNSDTDGDSYNDHDDAFPLSSEEWLDTDKDKIGNNLDTDDDNDGIPDHEDEYPLNKSPVIDLKDDSLTIGLFEKHTFDASPSYDEDGKIVSYFWEINGQIDKEGTSITHNFDKTGPQTVKLSIKDDHGETISREFQVNVINLRLYKQLGIILLSLLLALTIFFKYISVAKSPKVQK